MRNRCTVLALALAAAACGASSSAPTVPAHCVYGSGGTPDEHCTPGARDSRVTQANLHETVCKRGYSASVRPSESYTGPLKRRLMRAYGDQDSPAGYELDHRVSISLGGDPRAVSNLWPERGATPNSKDRLEFRLYDDLCAGRITLRQAQDRVLAWPGDNEGG